MAKYRVHFFKQAWIDVDNVEDEAKALDVALSMGDWYLVLSEANDGDWLVEDVEEIES